MTDAARADISKRDIRKRRSLTAQTTLKLLGRKGALLGVFWIVFTALLAIWAPFLANSRPLVWQVANDQGGWTTQFPLFAFLTPQDVMLAIGFLLALGLCACYRAGGKLFWVWLLPMAVTSIVSLIFFLIQENSELQTKLAAASEDFAKSSSDPNQRAVSQAWWALAQWWFIWSLAGLTMLSLMVLSVFKLKHHPQWLIVAGVLGSGIGAGLLMPGLQIKPRSEQGFDYATMRQQIALGQAKNAWFTLIPYSPDDLQTDAPAIPNRLSPGPSPRINDVAADMVSYMEQQFGIRLYTLDQANGTQAITPAPRTIEEALAAADRLWEAYQQQNQSDPTYNSQEASQLNDKIRKELDSFATTEIGMRYHFMGTTSNGEDLTSRMIHGSRIALVIGFIATGIAVFIGIFIGGLLGYFAGWVDLIGLRLVEIFASIPVIMLLIMIVAFYGRSLILMMIVLGLTGWVGYAYFVRAEFLKLRKMDYVMAARAAGTPLYLILFRHMLPNGVAPVLVGASFGIAGAIMTEATLSFLGLGLEKEPSWGQMLNQARQGGSFSWWLAIFPGAAIFLTVFAYNLIGEALRDVIDPRAVD